MNDETADKFQESFDLAHKIHPSHVMRTDQTIVAWNDVPEEYQKKILHGTMTEEDWDADWSIDPLTDRQKVMEILGRVKLND